MSQLDDWSMRQQLVNLLAETKKKVGRYW